MNRQEIKDLTISIVSYNSLKFLKPCLDSIYNDPHSIKYDIVVVDNASSDGSPKFIKNNYPLVILILNDKNIGFSAANNKAINRTNSKYIMLINSDCQVYEGSIDNLIEFMEKNTDIGIVGPKIVNSDGSIQHSCRRFPSIMNAGFHTILTGIAPNNPFSRKYKLADVNRDIPFGVDWVSGSCMVIRREALKDTGGLDENYFMYVEDIDICYRMWQENWKVYYYPHCKIMHHIGGSSGNQQVRASIRMQKSVFYFFCKNYKRSWKIILIPFLILVLGFRIFLTFIKNIFK